MRRRLESVEHQTEQLGRAVADSREVDGLREDAFKDRLTAIDKSVREVSRNIQLVRDKQVPAIHCEVAHCSHSQSLQIIHQNPLPHNMPLMQELAGAQAELAAHLSTKVVKSHCLFMAKRLYYLDLQYAPPSHSVPILPCTLQINAWHCLERPALLVYCLL